MSTEIRKTSEQWQQGCEYKVIDPDGWDRKNFDYSWNMELITFREFMDRSMRSTCENKNKVEVVCTCLKCGSVNDKAVCPNCDNE